VQGGEIFRILRQEGKFPNDVALFYITEIVLSIEYLHSIDIVYRDIKPENILIASDGHVKLTDFGFAKRVTERTFTMCGTPEYLAPEIIFSTGHTLGVDWWAIGVLLYEMVSGYPPFYDDNVLELYRKITVGKYEFGKGLTSSLKSLVSGLLEQDITKRLGCTNEGPSAIKKHSWFSGVDWAEVTRKEIPPPWAPDPQDPLDSSNYDKYEDVQLSDELPEEKDFKLFDDF